MTRTDIHRPSAPEFNPQSYDFVAGFDFDPEFPGTNLWALEKRKELTRAGYVHSGAWGQGRCDHCGARLRYAALMVHEGTKSFIYVGEQCLDNRFDLAAADFAFLRQEARLGRERKAKTVKIAELVEAHPLLAELTYNQRGTTTDSDEFLFSISEKLTKYGELSERQIEVATKTIVRRMGWQAKRDAEAAVRPAAPAPYGRMAIVGEIVYADWRDNGFGSSLKVRIYTDKGYSVWCSLPIKLVTGDDGMYLPAEAVKGKRVSMTVTVQQSENDETFAYGSRPAKAAFVA